MAGLSLAAVGAAPPASHFLSDRWHGRGRLSLTDFQYYPQVFRRRRGGKGRREDVMRDGIFIVDGDGHVMDFPHRCYTKYLADRCRPRMAFFAAAQWDRRHALNGA